MNTAPLNALEKKVHPQKLDALTFPLYGKRLIEASAGTGKTYTIASLYLRLLLGLGEKGSAHAKPLTVDQILVVTFTKVATEELRERIRGRIHDMCLALQERLNSDSLDTAPPQDPFFAALFAEIEDKKSAIKTLILAKQQMDEACIFTIHGFCQRMLTQNAFESGSRFENNFVTSEQELRLQTVQDFWRKYFYPLSAPVLKNILYIWSSPEALLADIQHFLARDVQIVSPRFKTDDLEAQIKAKLQVLAQMKEKWQQDRHLAANVLDLAQEHGVVLRKGSYNENTLQPVIESIDKWAESDLLNIPDKLANFSQAKLQKATTKKSTGKLPDIPLFVAIEHFLEEEATNMDILPACRAFAIEKITQMLQKEKNREQLLAFDDLLSQLATALRQDKQGVLVTRIREQFPIAMIDEFQDTDPLQYQIFSQIYEPIAQQEKESGLFMIGDPKQAIYAFRGADIYTYLQAKEAVSEQYQLFTNWRASADMVSAVNTLFSRTDKPFAKSHIDFYPVKARDNAKKMGWYVQDKKQKALVFYNKEDPEVLTQNQYIDTMAVLTVQQIQALLEESQQGQSYIVNDKGEKQSIQPQDIAVLVRTGKQAQKIKELLAHQGIASVYLSNRDNVFAQEVCRDLYQILKAILSPEDERSLRTALATKLFDLNADELDALNYDEVKWQNCVDEFISFKEIWQKKGIMPCIRTLLFKRDIPLLLQRKPNGERILTDLLHLADLLQEAAYSLESENALFHWFYETMMQVDNNLEAQQLRLESERNLVQIITIHKSKGLEYKFVFLPFACGFRKETTALFHETQSNEVALKLDLSQEKEHQDLADEERLAEDLRLVYVALTRAKYACFVGISDRKTRSNSKKSQLIDSGLGYLLLKGQAQNTYNEQLVALCTEDPSIHSIHLAMRLSAQKYRTYENTIPHLEALKQPRYIRSQWISTSYSGLIRPRYNTSSELDIPQLDIDVADETNEETTTGVSIFDFPKGAAAGTCLHSIFEQVDFKHKAPRAEVIHSLLKMYGYMGDLPEATAFLDEELVDRPSIWQPAIEKLVDDVLSTSLDGQALCLKDIPVQQRLAEMEFTFPMQEIQESQINRHILKYDPLSTKAGELQLDLIKYRQSGQIKGFIDLTFCYQGKYYVLDWKSNHLGNTGSDYSPEAIEQAMIEHRYDFQYQIYALALHRFLRTRIKNYRYETHFGGVYYVFLRGVSPQTANGIFYTKPSFALLDGLDKIMEHSQE